MKDSNNTAFNYKKAVFIFLLGVVCLYSIVALTEGIWASQQRKAYNIVNQAMTLKLRGDSAYKQFCSSKGLYEIERNWPSNSSSFYVVIEDQQWGSYEGKVFFDSGDVFGILTTKREAGIDKLDSFEKLKWPDIKQGDTYWRIE